MKRRGVEMRLIIDGDAAPLARIDLPLLDATARAVSMVQRSCWRVGRGRSAR